MYIKVEFSSAALWGSTDPDDCDREQSEKNYADSLVNHLYDAYPDAEIQVTRGDRDHITVDGRIDHDEVARISQLMDLVWNGDSWLVG